MGLIGQELKKIRTSLSMTQETVSEGICCVSYLSKVENNLISPNDDILEDLVKRMNIKSVKSFTTVIFDKYINALVSDNFSLKKEISVKIKEKIDFFKISYLGDLLLFGCMVNENDYKNVDKVLSNLYTLYENMLEDDLLFFVCFLINYYIDKNEYLEALKLLSMSKRFHNLSLEYQGIFYRNWILVLMSINKVNNIGTLIKEYNNICFQKSEYELIHQMKSIYYQYLLLEDRYADFEGEVKNDKKYRYNYPLIAYGYIMGDNPLMGIKELTKCKQKNKYYYLCMIKAYEKLNDSYKISLLFPEIEINDFDYTIDEIHYLNVMKKRYIEKNHLELKEYLRDVALNYYYNHFDLRHVYYYKNTLIECYKNDAQYKSIQLLNEKINKIEDIVKENAWK